MKDLLKIIKMASQEIDEAICMLSTVKDSLVTLDLCHKYIPKIKVVHLYFIKGLSYRERFLKYIENRYKLKIDQYPQVDISRIYKNQAFINNKKIQYKLKQADIELFLRRQYNISYLAYGYRKDESLQRRGQLTKCKGIEKQFKRFFPVADWSEKDIFNYLKKEKIALPVEYNYGYRDINFYNDECLIWLHRNYPEDYERMKKQYPFIEAELLRVSE